MEVEQGAYNHLININAMTDNSEKQDFKDLLRNFILPKVELISMAVIVIAFGLKFVNEEAFQNAIMIGLTSLAIVNYLRSFIYQDTFESNIDNYSQNRLHF